MALRLLRKLAVPEIGHPSLDHFRGGLSRPAENLLRHLPRLTQEGLDLACSQELEPHVTPRLLLEVVAHSDWTWWSEGRPSRRLADCLAMASRLGQAGRVGKVNSLRTLQRLHEALLLETLRAGIEPADPPGADRAISFPVPPVPGTPHIVPVTGLRELEEEGRLMRHCILSYAERVRAGRHYVYRVLGPERATLTLERRAGEQTWRLGEVNGPANTPVSEATREAIRAWLARDALSGASAERPAPRRPSAS